MAAAVAVALFSRLAGIILSTILYINLCLIHHIAAQSLFHNCTNPIANSTQLHNNNNAILQQNLNTILSSVATGINTFGFYNDTVGHGVDQVNAIALCRGDVSAALCRGCVNDAAQYLITTLCPYNHKEGIIWFEECMFRYSTNKPILGIMSLNPSYLLENKRNASNVDLYSQELRLFTAYLIDQTYKGSFRKFAARKSSDEDVNVGNNVETIYGFMQCTPDITPDDCMSCLNSSANSLLENYSSRVGARFLSPSCLFRYETYPFLSVLRSQPTPAAATPSSFGKSKTIAVIVCIIVVSLILTLSLLRVLIVRKRRRKQTQETTQQQQQQHNENEDAVLVKPTKLIEFTEDRDHRTKT